MSFLFRPRDPVSPSAHRRGNHLPRDGSSSPLFPYRSTSPFLFPLRRPLSPEEGHKKGPDPQKGPARHGCRMPQAPTIPGEDPRGIMHIIMALSAPFVTLQIIVRSSFPAVFRPRGRIVRHMLYVLRRSCQGSTRPNRQARAGRNPSGPPIWGPASPHRCGFEKNFHPSKRLLVGPMAFFLFRPRNGASRTQRSVTSASPTGHATGSGAIPSEASITVGMATRPVATVIPRRSDDAISAESRGISRLGANSAPSTREPIEALAVFEIARLRPIDKWIAQLHTQSVPLAKTWFCTSEQP